MSKLSPTSSELAPSIETAAEGVGPVVVGYASDHGSRNAVTLGLKLGHLMSENLRLLVTTVYVRPRLPLRSSNAEFDRVMRADADEISSSAKEHYVGDDACEFLVWGDSSVPAGLHHVAEEYAASLVVVGTSYESALGRMFAGSVSEQTLHGSPCAVVIMPRPEFSTKQESISRIAVAYDGGTEAEAALATAIELARRAGATLTLLQVVNQDAGWYSAYAGFSEVATLRDQVQDELQARCDLINGVSVDFAVTSGEVSEEISRRSEEFDLLVVGSRGFGPIRRVLLGSTSSRLVRHAKCPVMVLPALDIVESSAEVSSLEEQTIEA